MTACWHLDEIPLRDPFILADPSAQGYFLYGTTDPDPWNPPGIGFEVYFSQDLSMWSGPVSCFRPPSGFWADRHFWAPEVHRWGGRFWMLASFKASTRCRGTQLLAADTPSGPFQTVGEGPLTPPDWECLDGTLYVDEAGTPWLVFCREWLEVVDGEMYALRLDRQTLKPDSEPHLLFTASQAAWTQGALHDFGYGGVSRVLTRFITDGPWAHRLPSGRLVLLWSSHGKADHYSTGLAWSESGTILGPWIQAECPLLAEEGGHAMIFTDLAGVLCLAWHGPNQRPLERTRLYRVENLDRSPWMTLKPFSPDSSGSRQVDYE